MSFAGRQIEDAPTVCGYGSGVNWSGPKLRIPDTDIRVDIGYEWPTIRTWAMYYGVWEDAIPHMETINAFLSSHGLGPAVPNEGAPVGTTGFATRRLVARREKEYSQRRAAQEAKMLAYYRGEGITCPRRTTLEEVVATGKADGFWLKDQDVPAFLAAVKG